MDVCTWNRDKSGHEREVGCPLDHCPRGHHITEESVGGGKRGAIHFDGQPHAECWESSVLECTCAEEAEDCPGPFHLCASCQQLEIEHQVRQAERAAGWDPNP